MEFKVNFIKYMGETIEENICINKEYQNTYRIFKSDNSMFDGVIFRNLEHIKLYIKAVKESEVK